MRSALVLATPGFLCVAAFAQDGGAPAEPPAHVQEHVAAGLSKLRQGQTESAVADLRAAFAAKPGSAAIATDLGFALGKLGKSQEAEIYLRKAIELDPKRFYAYGNLAEVVAQSPERFRRVREITDLLQRGLARNADNDRAKLSITLALASFLRSVGQLADARALLAPLAGTNDGNGQRARDLLGGLASDESALALDDWPAPTLSSGEQHALDAAIHNLRAGDASKALAQASALVAQKPGWAEARLARGKALEALGRHDQAVQEISLLLQFRPSESEAWRLLGIILAKHGGALEAARAEEALRRALVLEPSWDDLRDLRREVADRRRESEGLKESSDTPPPSNKAREWYEEAQRWIEQDAPEMADVLLNRALADSPQFVDAAAASFLLTGKLPQATIKAIWNDGSALANLGLLLLAARNDVATSNLARPWLDRAVERGATEGRYARALLRSRENDRAGALADLQVYVTTVANPIHLDEARLLRANLTAGEARPDATVREARRLLFVDRPEAAARLLGGPCREGLSAQALLELGRVAEYAGDVGQAIACHGLAAKAAKATKAAKTGPSDGTHEMEALARLSLLAARAPVEKLPALESTLRRAWKATIPKAAWALARIEESRGHMMDAAGWARAYLGADDPDDTFRAQARSLIATIDQAAEQSRMERERRHLRVGLGCGIAFGLVLALWLGRRYHGSTLARALARKPDLFPELARTVAEIRHDLLKHRASALGMASDARACREDMARAILEPTPLSRALADLYAGLRDRGRALGIALRGLAREPVMGPLARDLARAERLLQGTGEPADLLALDRALRELHAPRLATLLSAGPRTTLRPAELAQWIRAVEAEVVQGQGRDHWTAPSILVTDLDLALPVPESVLATILSNLLRNASAAVRQASDRRVLVRIEQERDVTGRRLVSLLVADSAPESITMDSIEKRDRQRGLGIVRDLVRRWGGYLILRDEPAPLSKALGAAFPAVDIKPAADPTKGAS